MASGVETMPSAESIDKPAGEEGADEHSLIVDKSVWRYMEKSSVFGSEVRKVIAICQAPLISEISDGRLQLTVKASDPDLLKEVAEQLARLVSSCQATLETVKLPLQEEGVLKSVTDSLNSINESKPGNVEINDKQIIVTGNAEEVDTTLCMLEELWGVVRSEANDDSQTPALQLWKHACVEPKVIELDSNVWQYMLKPNGMWLPKIDALRGTANVKIAESVGSGDVVKIEVTGLNDGVEEVTSKLLQLLDDCRKSVRTVKASKLDEKVLTKASKFIAALNKSKAYVALTANIISLTGNDSEISDTKEKLKKLNILFDEDKPASTVGEDTAPKTLESDVPAKSQPNDEETLSAKLPSINIPSHLWNYMLKATGRWLAAIDELRNSSGVTVADSVVGSGELVQLELSGPTEVVDRLHQLIDECRSSTKTVQTSLREEKLMTKIGKFLPALNKSGAYVALVSDVVSVTGTSGEIDEVMGKLTKLGVTFEEASVPADLDSAGSSTHVARPSVAGSELGFRPDETPPMKEPSVTAISHRDGDGRVSTELPVPIEETLWMFVEKRRTALLQELREVYNVTISSFPADEGYVYITLSADSYDMLDCGQESMIQILEQLRNTIIVNILETESGAAGLPPEVGQLFNQLASSTDAIVLVSGSKIIIVGPQAAAAECQQKIAAFVQQQQGGGRGMRRPQGGGNIGGPGMGMGMGMGMGGGMGGQYQGFDGMAGNGMSLGGVGLPMGTGSEEDFMNAMRNQRLQQLGGTGANRAIGGVPTGRGTGLSLPPGMEDMMAEDDDFRRMGLFDDATVDPVSGRTGRSMNEARNDKAATKASQAQQGTLLSADAKLPELSRRETQATASTAPGATKSAAVGGAAGTKPKVRFADEQPAEPPAPVMTSFKREESCDVVSPSPGGRCSVCQQQEPGSSAETDSQCQHAFCIPCLQEYISSKDEPCCPICDDSQDKAAEASRRPPTQPRDGVMSVTYDNTFRLPGFETRSRGTIVIIYSFPPGVQKDFQPHPGKKYSGITRTAFLPLTSEGSRIVERLQKAFDDGRVFGMAPSEDGKADEIGWQGIHHKTSIYAEPNSCGYPDPFYLHRVQNQLKLCGLQ